MIPFTQTVSSIGGPDECYGCGDQGTLERNNNLGFKVSCITKKEEQGGSCANTSWRRDAGMAEREWSMMQEVSALRAQLEDAQFCLIHHRKRSS